MFWVILGGIATVVIALLLANYFIPLPSRDLIDGPPFSNIQNVSTIEGTDIPRTPSPSIEEMINEPSSGASLISSLTDYMKKQASSIAPAPTEEMQKTLCAVPAGQTESVCTISSITLEEDPRLKLFEEL
jgi:hypothetical protein